jgi:hypothetical protein
LDIADRWLTAGGLEHDGTEWERVAFEGDLPPDRYPIGPVAAASRKNQHHRSCSPQQVGSGLLVVMENQQPLPHCK